MQNINKGLMVSIAVITYNHELFISKAINSILLQKCNFKFDIVIGDDCSQDKTSEILHFYKNKYPDIISLFINDVNKGLLMNYKNVTDKCQGKYIAVCSGDDYWNDDTKLQKQIDFLESHEDYGLVHSNVNICMQNKIISHKKRIVPDGFVFDQLLQNGNFIYAVTACFRNDIFKQHISINEFIENKFMMEDLPIWIELARITKVHFFKETFATYRIHEHSLSNSLDFNKIESFHWSSFEIIIFYVNKYSFIIDIEKLKQSIYYNLTKTAIINNLFEGAKKYSIKLYSNNLTTLLLKLCGMNKYLLFISYSVYCIMLSVRQRFHKMNEFILSDQN